MANPSRTPVRPLKCRDGNLAKELVKYIQRSDDDLAAKEAKKVWGDGYPKLKGTI